MEKEHFEFTEEEIPYSILEKFGLTQEMIEDLPDESYHDILRGNRSPVLPVTVKDADGTVVSARSRIRIVKDKDGSVDVVFYPRMKYCDLEKFSESERMLMQKGQAIISEFPEGRSVKSFIQIDRETNQVMCVPTPVIGRNLSLLADKYHLDAPDLSFLQKGEPVLIRDNGELVTAGIDLTEKTGIRIERGDTIMNWGREPEAGMDRFSFGIYGCWVRNDEGDLNYVREEDYTDEILKAQERAVERNTGMKR